MSGAISSPAADLLVPPYTLGAWLGDGHSNSGGLAGIDPEIWEAIEADGYVVTHSAKLAVVHTIHGLVGSLRQIGVLGDKHIPAAYLRASIEQRLELLQGLMDTDGTVTEGGRCAFDQRNRRLADDVLELVRSLGIRAHMSHRMARITEDDPDRPGFKRRRETGMCARISFRTDMTVFKLPRKVVRLTEPGGLSASLRWNRIVDVAKLGTAPGRCLRVNTPSHLYLVEGFIPTHNTVTLNALIADQLASGASLCVADDVSKAVDFFWCKDFVRDGGWGCDSDRAAVAALALVYVEGKRRAKVLGESGYVNWLDMPKGQRFQPIFVVVDEVSALLVTDKIPSGVPKTHPLVQEMLESNLMKVQLASYISKIVAELRFVGVRMVLSTQVTNNNTGVPPSLKAKISNKLLAGVNPSKSARVQAFSDESAVPTVPENVKAGGKRARGVGAADLESQAPTIYKSFFASTQEYRAHLERLGVSKTSQPAPTAFQVAKYTPSLDDDGLDDRPSSPLDQGGFGAPDGRDDDGPRLMGAAKAAHQLKVDAAAHAKTQAQDR